MNGAALLEDEVASHGSLGEVVPVGPAEAEDTTRGVGRKAEPKGQVLPRGADHVAVEGALLPHTEKECIIEEIKLS